MLLVQNRTKRNLGFQVTGQLCSETFFPNVFMVTHLRSKDSSRQTIIFSTLLAVVLMHFNRSSCESSPTSQQLSRVIFDSTA